MISLNNSTDFNKTLSGEIQVKSSLHLIDAYDHEEVEAIVVKQGSWQSQAGFSSRHEYQSAYLMREWGARIAQALVESAGDDFDLISEIADLSEPTLSVEIFSNSIFQDNSAALLKGFKAVQAGFNATQEDELNALAAASTIIRETKGFLIHNIKRDIIKALDTSDQTNPNIPTQEKTDQEMIEDVRKNVELHVDFEKSFLESVASKDIQYIQLKNNTVSEFTALDSEEWKLLSCVSTSSGRMGLVDQEWLTESNKESITHALECLSIDYRVVDELRNPSNFKKIEACEFGVGAVTLHRDSYNSIFAIKDKDGDVVELVVLFDGKYED